MTYRVIVTPSGERSQDYLSIHPQSGAARGKQGLKRARQAVKTVTRHPERCPLVPESASFGEPIRELFLGSGNRGTYRFLFTVVNRTVYVVHVRHGSMLSLSPEE